MFCNARVNDVLEAALFVTITLFVFTAKESRASSKSKLAPANQSDCRTAPLVGFTDKSCGGRVSGSFRILDAKVVLPAESVSLTVAVMFVPVVGAEAIENVNMFVIAVKGVEATFRV